MGERWSEGNYSLLMFNPEKEAVPAVVVDANLLDSLNAR
jgi:hypothetical protein